MRSVNDVRDERGAATVEFLGFTLVLLIPVVYLMIYVSQVQAAAFASVAAADQAVKAVVEAKLKGGEVKKPVEAAESEGEVVDLLAALQQSVDRAKKARGEAAG